MKRIQSLFLGTVLITAIAGFSLGWFFANNVNSAPASIVGGVSSQNQKDGSPVIHDLPAVWDKLQNEYYDHEKLQMSKLGFGAIKGLIASIGDPYTVFMTPEESKEFGSELDGQLEGIGAQLDAKNGKLVVVAPMKGSPAEKAGIRAGDTILKIDDRIAEDMTLYDAVSAIRGKKGTSVTLIVLHDGSKEPEKITVVRDEILVDTIVVKKLDHDIFHISINKFNDHTAREFADATQRILLEKASGVIIDVRGNGGGYLEIAVDLVSELVAGKKTAVIIQKRDSTKNEVLQTSGAAKLPDIPMVVLIDKGSASASEILAGALQDYKRAVLIGETSFGKGSVQEVSDFDDGAKLRMTIAHWLTPLERSINNVGLKPDIDVKYTEEDAKADRDPQLDAAVEYLKRK